MKITDDMLTGWRKQFEAEFPMPPDCIWTGKGYAATSYNAWEARTFIARFEGWVAARRTTPDREAIIEECAKVMDDRAAEIEANDNLTSMTMGRIYRAEAERIRALKAAPNGEKK
ncbi:hypothetical protein QZN30_17785 [Burkholderia multivorans]|nr:hypothetical protein [Burkholderia multivorans]